MTETEKTENKRSGKSVLSIEDTPADLVEAIAATVMDPRHEHLNNLMDDDGDEDTRPLFDDLIAEQAAFIGPPAPPQIPKLTPASQREIVRQMMLQDLAERIADETAAYRSDPGSNWRAPQSVGQPEPEPSMAPCAPSSSNGIPH